MRTTIEQIWLKMKARWFNNYVCRNVDQLIDRLDQANIDVINNTDLTQKNGFNRKIIMRNNGLWPATLRTTHGYKICTSSWATCAVIRYGYGYCSI